LEILSLLVGDTNSFEKYFSSGSNQGDLIRGFFWFEKEYLHECSRRRTVWCHRVIAAIFGGIVIWFLFYAFLGQTEPPSNLTEETLKRLIGSTGRATSDITESAGTVLVNSEEFSAMTSKGMLQKGTRVIVRETDGLTLMVEKA